MKSAALLNDTTREAGHIGCELTVRNILAACLATGITVSVRDQGIKEDFDETAFVESIRACDIVIVNGEGTLHHNAGLGILKRCKLAKSVGKPIFLVNAVWQSNEFSKQNLDLFDLVFVREPASHREISRDGRPDAKVVPDMVFYCPAFEPIDSMREPTKGGIAIDSVILGVTREISEFARANRVPFYFMGEWHRRNFAKHYPLRFLRSRASGGCLLSLGAIVSREYLVSGRYHGACFSIASGTPFLAVASNTHKIEGLVESLGLDQRTFVLPNSGLASRTIEDALSHLMRYIDRIEFASRCSAFLAEARTATLEMFHEIYRH